MTKAENERDAALARVRELEGMADEWQQQAMIFQAQGAENARFRHDFEATGWTFRESCPECMAIHDAVHALRDSLARKP